MEKILGITITLLFVLTACGENTDVDNEEVIDGDLEEQVEVADEENGEEAEESEDNLDEGEEPVLEINEETSIEDEAEVVTGKYFSTSFGGLDVYFKPDDLSFLNGEDTYIYSSGGISEIAALYEVEDVECPDFSGTATVRIENLEYREFDDLVGDMPNAGWFADFVEVVERSEPVCGL